MSLRLSDNDRTLLSAYMDGELHGDELLRVESLVSGSEEARTYLGHLRSLKGFSTQAFPAVSIGAAAGAAGKLSGSAITAAAKKSALVKGFSFGGWGATGLVAAASVAAGVTFAVNDGPAPEHARSRPVHAVAARTAPSMDIDTNDLIVPPMTPSEMIHFAVDGTVPIDATRKQYLTLASHGRDSMVVELRHTPPELSVDLDGIEPSQWRELDSVHRAIRTALLQYKGKRIAISCDIPSLRLKALEHLERIRTKLPTPLWEEIESVKRQVASSRSTADRPSYAGERNNGVPYVVVSLDSFGDRTFERIRIPDPVAPVEGSFNVMLVSGATLGELQAMTPAPVTSTATFQAGAMTFRQYEPKPQRTVRAFNPTGELPTQRESQEPLLENHPMLFDEELQMGNGETFISSGNEGAFTIHGNGKQLTIAIDGDTLIRNIENALKTVDSTLMRIDSRIPRMIQERRSDTRRRMKEAQEELDRNMKELDESQRQLRQRMEKLNEGQKELKQKLEKTDDRKKQSYRMMLQDSGSGSRATIRVGSMRMDAGVGGSTMSVETDDEP